MQWHFKLFPLCRDMLGLATNPIPIKAAMKMLGRDTGELRLPMTPLDESQEKDLGATLRHTACCSRSRRRYSGMDAKPTACTSIATAKPSARGSWFAHVCPRVPLPACPAVRMSFGRPPAWETRPSTALADKPPVAPRPSRLFDLVTL